MDLACYIAQFCLQHNISKEMLAKNAAMSRSTLYRMIEEDTMPSLSNLSKLAIAMQVHPQYLVKLKWDTHQLSDCQATPIDALIEPTRWFHEQQDSSHFISETVADGSLVCTGERFTKTWRLQNTGNKVWENRTLQCQDGQKIRQQQPKLKPFAKERNFSLRPITFNIDIPTTAPGNTVDLSVDFIAPDIPAHAFSYWKMLDANGKICFPDSIGVYVDVKVISAGSACDLTVEKL